MRVTLEMAAACITICTVWLLLLGAVEQHAACVRECMSLQPAAFRPTEPKASQRSERRVHRLSVPRPATGAAPHAQFLLSPDSSHVSPSWSEGVSGRMPPCR